MERKNRLGLLGFGLAFGMLVAGMAYIIDNGIKSDRDSLEEFIGEEVVVAGDTLVVVSYSIWTEDLTLNNGTTVAKSFINKSK